MSNTAIFNGVELKVGDHVLYNNKQRIIRRIHDGRIVYLKKVNGWFCVCKRCPANRSKFNLIPTFQYRKSS